VVTNPVVLGLDLIVEQAFCSQLGVQH
jgi:hypothetical protein